MTQSIKRGGMAVLMALLFIAFASPARAESLDSGKAVNKLLRGFLNTVTGWVEIPKRAKETAATSGTAAGLTWGILRGIGHGFVRTAGGLYEIFTFPFPAPPNYAPVIQPEYVFSESVSNPQPARSH